MARYKCNNCGHTFTVYVGKRTWFEEIRCPSCHSTWVEYIGPDNYTPIVWVKERPFEPMMRCSWGGQNQHIQG